MDWLTFIAKILEFTTWPVVAIVLVVLLRSEIKRLVPLLKKLKAGPLEAEFEREVRELRATAEAQVPPAPPESVSPEKQKLFQLVQINPRSAILEAWQGVEAATLRVLDHKGIFVQVREASSPLAVIRALSRENLLGSDEISLYHELRSLRNQAVHSPEFSPTVEAALNYIELASGLRVSLERVANDG